MNVVFVLLVWGSVGMPDVYVFKNLAGCQSEGAYLAARHHVEVKCLERSVE